MRNRLYAMILELMQGDTKGSGNAAEPMSPNVM